jgi:hypothetical protein
VTAIPRSTFSRDSCRPGNWPLPMDA